MTAVVILIVVLIIVAALAIPMLIARKGPHPEQAATHTDDLSDDETSERFYRGVDRPAGPDAEDPIGPTRRTDET